MGAAVGLRGDYAAGQLRGLAKRSVDAAQTRRLLALAAIYEGGSRTEAAKIGGVGLQTVRDWVLAFNAEGPGGLINGKAPGNASLLDDEQRQALARIVESGPIRGGARGGALAADRPGAMGIRGLRHRDQQADLEPRAARAGLAQIVGPAASSCPRRRGRRGVQKNFAASLAQIAEQQAAGQPIEIWFQVKLASARRTRSQGAGRDAAPGPRRRTISAPARPTSSVRSARRAALRPAWCCRAATPLPWRCIWRRSPRRSNRVATPCCCSIRPAGISPTSSPFPTTSP